ncbi:MAG: TMEM175 family protein [Chloroflexia bacterium]
MSISEIETSEAKETGRIEAFSDGVFAIAVTLLVLDIKVPQLPEGQATALALLEALRKQWPSYLAYVISFATIGIMWINHHRLLTLIKRSNHTFLLLNTFLLFWVTFVPFPTSLLAEYVARPEPGLAEIGALVYSGTFILTAVAFNLLWRYASFKNRLIDRKANPESVKAISTAYVFGPILYAVAFVLALVSPMASVIMNMLLAIYFALPERTGRSMYTGDQGSGVGD